ncbi:hypothetical protein BDW75DRAFT_221589 [Aspergillus navahoensis]
MKFRRQEDQDTAGVVVKDIRDSIQLRRAESRSVSVGCVRRRDPLSPASVARSRRAVTDLSRTGQLHPGGPASDLVHLPHGGRRQALLPLDQGPGRGVSACAGPRHRRAIPPPDAVWEDRVQVRRQSGKNPGKLEDHPEYTLLPFTPPGHIRSQGSTQSLSAASWSTLPSRYRPARC